MKYIFANYFFIPLIIIILIILLSTCTESTDCEAFILVKFQNDTNMPVPNARVVLFRGNINDTDITSASGECVFKYDLEAILQINVNVDTIDGPYGNHSHFCGGGTIHLISGETVSKTIYVDTICN